MTHLSSSRPGTCSLHYATPRCSGEASAGRRQGVAAKQTACRVVQSVYERLCLPQLQLRRDKVVEPDVGVHQTEG